MTTHSTSPLSPSSPALAGGRALLSRALLIQTIAALLALGGLCLPATAIAAGNVYATSEFEEPGLWQYTAGSNGALSAGVPASMPIESSATNFALGPDGRNLYAGGHGIFDYKVEASGTIPAQTPVFTELPGSEGTDAIAVSPNGKSLYVASWFSIWQYHVSKEGGLTLVATPTTVSGDGIVLRLALAPDGKSLYAVTGSEIWQYDVSGTGKLSPKTPATVLTTEEAGAIAISPDGKNAYVAGSYPAGRAWQYGIEPSGTLAPLAPATVEGVEGPTDMAISPDGSSVYVSDGANDMISQYSRGVGGALIPKTPSTVATGIFPDGIAISPDGKSLYAATDGEFKTRQTLWQYVVGAGGLLTANTPATVESGAIDRRVAVLPDQGPTAAFAKRIAPAGSLSKFNGSRSSDPDGEVVRYDWNLGDGTLIENGGPVVKHVYTVSGEYTVTLTVTDSAGCSTTVIYTGQATLCNGGPRAEKSKVITVP